MPRRSSLLQIPTELRERLNARLVQQGFSDYDGLLDWLHDELETAGLELRISRTALWRHGQKFEERLERLRLATERAKAITEGAEDDEGAMNEALVRLVQYENFELLEAMDEMELDPAERAKVLNKLNMGIARIVRASVASKKWMQEARDKLRAATEAVKATAKRGGLSEAAIAEIEERLNIL